MPSAVTDTSVLVRRLDVTTRPPNAVASMVSDSEGGLLLETFMGRYVLNADARNVWLMIDGHRTVSEIAAAVATSMAVEAGSVADGVSQVCRQLHELGLVEEANSGLPARSNPVAQAAHSH